MPGPFIVFGVSAAMSLWAGHQRDEEEEERASSKRRKLGLEKPYRYETCCIHSDYESITSMTEQSSDVSYRTMLKYCDLASWAEDHGYEVRQNVGHGLTLKGDWHVSYHKSVYRGKPCYYLVHSHIEYIWVLDE